MAKEIKITSEKKNEDIEKVEIDGKNLRIKFKFSKEHAVIILSLVLLALIPSFYFITNTSPRKICYRIQKR